MDVHVLCLEEGPRRSEKIRPARLANEGHEKTSSCHSSDSMNVQPYLPPPSYPQIRAVMQRSKRVSRQERLTPVPCSLPTLLLTVNYKDNAAFTLQEHQVISQCLLCQSQGLLTPYLKGASCSHAFS